MTVASLADVQAFQALEPELQAQLVRLFGFNPLDQSVASSDNELEAAYAAGFEDCADEMFVPSYSRDRWAAWMRRHYGERGGA